MMFQPHHINIGTIGTQEGAAKYSCTEGTQIPGWSQAPKRNNKMRAPKMAIPDE